MFSIDNYGLVGYWTHVELLVVIHNLTAKISGIVTIANNPCNCVYTSKFETKHKCRILCFWFSGSQTVNRGTTHQGMADFGPGPILNFDFTFRSKLLRGASVSWLRYQYWKYQKHIKKNHTLFIVSVSIKRVRKLQMHLYKRNKYSTNHLNEPRCRESPQVVYFIRVLANIT